MRKMYNSLKVLLILLLGVHFSSVAQTVSFSYTGGPQTYTVPAGVSAISVLVQGAEGGLNSDETDFPDVAGRGGCVRAIIAVTPGQVLQINVGGRGQNGSATAGGAGGYNGGGDGSYGVATYSGGGGGGASDVRLFPFAPGDRLVVAGGGGGAGLQCGGDLDRGGNGGANIGGTTGEDGVGCGATTGGGGGTSGAFGGFGGICPSCVGSPGSDGTITDGGAGGVTSAGGGGGGGFYGGGGGQFSGGGGGADYFGAPGVSLVTESRGCRTGNGLVTVSVYCVAGAISGADNLCVGSSTTLSDPAPGGRWFSGDLSKATIDTFTGLVTGVGAGVVTISYEVIAGIPGCRATTQLTVNPVPAPISGPFFVCEGSSIAFIDTDPGGTWSSANTAIATIGSSTGVIVGVSAGSVDISYTFTTTGCATVRSLVVNPRPSAIVGTPAVCEGSCVTLTDPDPGGTWSSTSTGTATITTGGLVCGVSAGISTISYMIGVCAATVSFSVNPNPTVPSGSGTVCMGSNITLTSTPGGGTWTSGTPGVATIGSSDGVVTPVTCPGSTIITYTLPTTCSRTRTISTNCLPAAIGGPSVVCEGSTITLTDGVSGSWSVAPTTVATVTPGPGTSTTLRGMGIIGTGGVATVTFTATSTSCSVTRTVTVNPRPDTIKMTNPVCTGNCVAVLTGPAGGTWTSGTPSVGAVGSTTDFCAVAAGTTNIVYTLPGTGCARSLIVTVNTTPPPITGPTQVCVGQTVTNVCAVGGGTWTAVPGTGSVTIVPAGTSVAVTGATVGTDTLFYTLPTGCFQSIVDTVLPLPSIIDGTLTIMCEGDTTYLTDTITGGIWTSNLTGVATIGSTTGMVIGTGGGVVTFTYTMGSGCYQTYSMTIVGKPSVITGPLNVCAGASTFTLTSGGGAGTWTCTPSTVATITAGTGDVTAVGPGTATVCYTFVAAPGCFRCTTLNVNPNPTSISGPNTVCVGSQVAETSSPGGGNWTFTNPNATVVIGTGIVTGVTPGNDTLIYTLPTGCTVRKPMVVVASPNPITFTTLNICQGQTLTLTETTPGGTWSSANTAVGTISPTTGTTTVVTGVGPGTDTIRYTNGSGCSRFVVVTVTAFSTAITGPSSVCMGSTITLSEAPAVGNWSSSPTTVATVGAGPSTTTIVTPVSTGTVTVTFNNGGCAISKVITVNPTPIAAITPLGPTDLCPGNVVALTATTGVGYTYVWRNPGVIAGATSSSYVTGVAGNYFVVVTLGPCSATSSNQPVTVNPVIAGISPTTLVTCASSMPTLNATPTGAGITYQWLFGGVPIVGAVGATYTPTLSGTYTVKVTNVFGCWSISPTSTVTLLSSPPSTITVTGSLSFCAGSSVTLTGNPGTGLTYQWKLGGLPITGATNITYVATLAGTYTLLVSNSGCGTTSAPVTVTVNPAPPATIVAAGDTVFCTGGNVILAAPAGAYTYQWYKAGVVIPGATNVTYTATTTGSYKVKVTSIVGGCTAMSIAKNVTAVSAPLISPLSATSFCWGGSVSLSAIVVAGAGPITYQWFKNGVAIVGATTATYVARHTGLYSVMITVGTLSTCSIFSASTTVTEWPLPNPIVSFDGVNLSTTTFVSYQWYKNSVVIAGATSFRCRNRGLGSYTVIVTDIHGCQSVSPAYVVTHITPGPPEPTATNGLVDITISGDIRIFPNPAQNMIHIESENVVRAVITSLDGRIVIDMPEAKDVSISGIADGIYLVKLFNTDGSLVKTEKLVKASN